MKIEIQITNWSIVFDKEVDSWLYSVQVLYSELAGMEKFRTPSLKTTKSFSAYQTFKRRMKLK